MGGARRGAWRSLALLPAMGRGVEGVRPWPRGARHPNWTQRRTSTRMRMLESELMTPPPESRVPRSRAAAKLASWLGSLETVTVLTGAGASTDSGIPDYRGADGSYRRGHKPMSHDDFISSQDNRRRYWARALRGYDRFAASEPNDFHRAVAELQKSGKVAGVITQNVDGLHEKCSAENVVALHGRGDRVTCLECGAVGCRAEYHDVLKRLNGVSDAVSDSRLRPDGDADVELGNLDDFELPACDVCDVGVLKPDVVFFGDNVPRSRVDRCLDFIHRSDGLLCCGTSLAVYSSYRFVIAAHKLGKPICVLNLGKTRAEIENIDLLKIDAPVDALARALPLL